MNYWGSVSEMLNKFEETKRKQRFGLRKLKVGVASVLLGFTIFGFNLASQELPSVHADVASGSDSSSEVSAVSTNGTSENVDQTATSDSTNTPGGKPGQLRKPVRLLRVLIRKLLQKPITRQQQMPPARELRPTREI